MLFRSFSVSLEGKVAIVTGGSGGIGSATCRLFAARGAKVMIADLRIDQARALASEIGPAARACALDLARPASIEAMITSTLEQFGRLDILHNNAAFLEQEASRDGDVEHMDLALWDKTFAINVRGAMWAAKVALPHLVATGQGVIINTVSNLALQGHIVQAAYAASKAALIQLTRSIAASHGRRGVRCNAVAPGMTLTPNLKAAFPPELRQIVQSETLRDRLGEPEDIAEVVAFLASDAARNITGQCIVADGGLASHVPGIEPFETFLRS